MVKPTIEANILIGGNIVVDFGGSSRLAVRFTEDFHWLVGLWLAESLRSTSSIYILPSWPLGTRLLRRPPCAYVVTMEHDGSMVVCALTDTPPDPGRGCVRTLSTWRLEYKTMN